MTKFLTRGRLVWLIFGIILMILGIALVIPFTSYGKDCTEEYNIYKQVEELDTLEDVRSKLQELKVEYSVTSTTISLTDYDNISFSLRQDDTCFVNFNLFMCSFKKLDLEDRTTVEIYGILDDDKITEKVTLNQDSYTFTKINNRYYLIQHMMLLIPSGMIVASTVMLTIFVMYAISYRKQKAKQCSPQFPIE